MRTWQHPCCNTKHNRCFTPVALITTTTISIYHRFQFFDCLQGGHTASSDSPPFESSIRVCAEYFGVVSCRRPPMHIRKRFKTVVKLAEGIMKVQFARIRDVEDNVGRYSVPLSVFQMLCKDLLRLCCFTILQP